MAGCSRIQSHFIQRQADFPAGVFTLIQRGNIQIAALVAGLPRGLALHVSFKEVEFTARPHFALVALVLNGFHGLAQILPEIVFIRGSVHAVQGAEKAYHPAGLRPPRQRGKRGGIRL